jgi:hypothetical protein
MIPLEVLLHLCHEQRIGLHRGRRLASKPIVPPRTV